MNRPNYLEIVRSDALPLHWAVKLGLWEQATMLCAVPNLIFIHYGNSVEAYWNPPNDRTGGLFYARWDLKS